MRPTDKKIENLLKNLNDQTRPELDEKILDDCLTELNTQKSSDPVQGQNIWSIIMKKPMTKFAAAAIVFIAVIFGVKLIPGTSDPVALASVIETFKNAVCISYDIKVGKDSPPIHDTIYQNIIRREVLGSTTVIDLDNKKILSIMHAEKKAVMMGIDGLPELPKNYIDHLVNILSTLQQKEIVTSEYLDSREIDGQEQIGYFFESENIQVELWMDADTSLPVVITAIRPGIDVTMENFNFEETVDPSLFEMTAPKGYVMMNMQGMFDFKKDDNEETFIEGLRLQTVLYDGWFPRDVSIESYLKRATEIGSLVEQKFKGTLAQMQAGVKLGKGLIFLRFWKGQGPWHYAGNGVQLGQSDEPIFWYQPKDSDVFRVIFGDLHVEEVAPEDVEELVADRKAFENLGYQIWEKPETAGHQEDNWHVMAGDIIEVHSKIEIKYGPADLSTIDMIPPYENAQLLSATFGQTPLEYEMIEDTSYRFFPDHQQLASGEQIINLIWQFPLENLELVDYGYKVILQSQLPVTVYNLHVTLEPDCGYIHKDDPELRTFDPFSQNGGEPKTTFGTCGLCIKPE